MSLTTGSRLGAYEILGPLGAGGMGEVYRARDLRLGREVAVKVLPAEVASSPERLARFEREARTVAGLNHPNIVTLHSIEEADGVRFLTLELVEGQTLSALVAPGGLPVARLLDLAIPLADALVAAHERGVTHRDLKPGNVMVTRDGRVKVLDFGLAKLTQTEPSPELTHAATVVAPISQAGQVVGTVPYMAPEQLRGEAADARSDLFALGVILYELAAGRRPFAGETSVDISHAILHDEPKRLADARADLPPDLERIVLRCLEKAPRERFQTALDVANELRRLRRERERGGSAAVEKGPAGRTASIAVLPFVNRSPSAEDEYFSDGLADELLNVLAKIKGLRVAARTSSFQFKATSDDLATIGRKLNVATLLEGSVRKAGNRVRISVELVKVEDGYQLWSETYDRTLEDVFAVQDDIARSVVKELRTTLLGEEAGSDASGQARADVAQAAKGRGTDPEAHRLFLLARHLINQWTREGAENGIKYLKQALARDPEFALAWAEMGQAFITQAGRGWAPVAEAQVHARDAIRHALALVPDLPEAHVANGVLHMFYDHDFRAAQASFARALELAPGNARALSMAGGLASALGRYEQAIDLVRRSTEQDPLSSASQHNLGLTFQAAKRFGEAETAFRKALELGPQRAGTRSWLALVLLELGRGTEALAEALRDPAQETRLWALAIVHHALGHGAESDAALRELIATCSESAQVQIAEAHAARGEVEPAFDWLERAYAQHDPGLVELNMSRYLRPFGGDPRWAALSKRIGFEP